jgi:4-amino-4-deoxy-L-arabinose transferase-like glycosyltransferase
MEPGQRRQPIPNSPRWRETALPWLALPVFLAAYIATGTWHEQFWWSDAPQHALNGALVHDWLASGHWRDPMGFAQAYFLRYPAINIALYPPLFPVLEAISYTLFGVSHAAAQGVVTCFTLLAMVSAYRIARLALPPAAATGAVAMLLGLPIVALWSRQVMLDMPALALLLAGSVPLLRYARAPLARDLYQASLWLLLAIYMKQTAGFVLPAWAGLLLWEQGWAPLRRRHVWVAAAGFVVGLAPLVAFTLVMARYNLQTAASAGGRPLVEALSFYLVSVPATAGVPLALAGLAYAALMGWRGPRNPAEQLLARWALLWVVVCFVVNTAVSHKEERYAVVMVAPLAMVGALLAYRLLARTGTARSWLVGAVGAGALALTLAMWPARYVAGYDKAAAYVLAHAKPGSVVLFHGLRSPNFAFSLRSRSDTPNLYVLRAEKLLVRYTVLRDYGITDRGVTPQALQGIIDRYGIEYIVMQPDFWVDQPSVAAFQALVRGGGFTRVAVIPVTANIDDAEPTIEIWRNLHPVARTDNQISLDLPVLGRTLNGTLAPAAQAGHAP